MTRGLLVVALALGACWPPMKVSVAAGGSFGGARAYERSGPIETGAIPAFQGRWMFLPSNLVSRLRRHVDVGVGYMREELRSGSKRYVRQGASFEMTGFVAGGLTTPSTGWRIGLTATGDLYESNGQRADDKATGIGVLVGVVAELAVDDDAIGGSDPQGRWLLGSLFGEAAIGVFLRGGVRGEAGEKDAVVLAGVEVRFPWYCGVCPSPPRVSR